MDAQKWKLLNALVFEQAKRLQDGQHSTAEDWYEIADELTRAADLARAEGAHLDTGYDPADIPADQLQAVIVYARQHGRTWKADLREEWLNSTAGPELQRLRNTRGPSWLVRFRLPAR